MSNPLFGSRPAARKPVFSDERLAEIAKSIQADVASDDARKGVVEIRNYLVQHPTADISVMLDAMIKAYAAQEHDYIKNDFDNPRLHVLFSQKLTNAIEALDDEPLQEVLDVAAQAALLVFYAEHPDELALIPVPSTEAAATFYNQAAKATLALSNLELDDFSQNLAQQFFTEFKPKAAKCFEEDFSLELSDVFTLSQEEQAQVDENARNAGSRFLRDWSDKFKYNEANPNLEEWLQAGEQARSAMFGSQIGSMVSKFKELAEDNNELAVKCFLGEQGFAKIKEGVKAKVPAEYAQELEKDGVELLPVQSFFVWLQAYGYSPDAKERHAPKDRVDQMLENVQVKAVQGETEKTVEEPKEQDKTFNDVN